jgi:hypothetical protein
VPVLGGEEHLVLENASQPIPLNDGTILIGRVNPQGQKQLFRFTPETGKLQGFPVVFSGELFGYLQILRDGKHVLTRGWMIGHSQEKVAFLEVDLATSAVRRIPDVGVEVRAWTPSADGKSILVATKAGSLVRVIAMPLDGRTPPQTLFTITDDIWDIDAGADGSVFADLMSRPAGVVRLSPRGGPAEKIASLPQFPDMDMVVALPDGRAVAPVLVSGRTRLMAVEQGKDPVLLVNTTEETAAPMTVAGSQNIAFAIGPLPHHTIAIADTSNGRISGRISPGKGAITSLAATPDGGTIYFAAGGTIWSVPAGGGDAHKIVGGEDVMWDPSRHGLVIVRRESSHMTLWRTTPEGGAEQQIPIDSAAPFFENILLTGHDSPRRPDVSFVESARLVVQSTRAARYGHRPRHPPAEQRNHRLPFPGMDAGRPHRRDPTRRARDNLEVHSVEQITTRARYSARRASTGLTEAARRAGIKLASSEEMPSTPATAASVGTSQVRTPNRRPRISVAAATEHPRPITTPAPISPPASFRISRYTELRCAPNAMRAPISRVRWLTE